MPERPFSPPPFRVTPGVGTWLILDCTGDSIGVLPRRTGYHRPREQEANAVLFRASPELLAGLEFALPHAEAAWHRAEAAAPTGIEAHRRWLEQPEIADLFDRLQAARAALAAAVHGRVSDTTERL